MYERFLRGWLMFLLALTGVMVIAFEIWSKRHMYVWDFLYLAGYLPFVVAWFRRAKKEENESWAKVLFGGLVVIVVATVVKYLWSL